MNPLCCIAPVSIDRDRANSVVAKSPSQCQLGLDAAVRTVNYASKSSFSTMDSSVGADSVKTSAAADLEEEEEPRDSKAYGVAGSVAGILYKWVNYGKGWRSRWFVLEDGVLSYYKIHGPDKILMSPARDRSVRVIGEESSKYVKKANWNLNRVPSGGAGGGNSNNGKQCKPFGEIHLKVCSYDIIRCRQSLYVCVCIYVLQHLLTIGVAKLHHECTLLLFLFFWSQSLALKY